MTMVFTDAALGEFLAGAIDWTSDSFKLVLTDNAATPDSSPYLSDLDTAHTVASGPITGATVAGRTALCGTVAVTGVPSGKTVVGMWIVRDTGSPSTSRLVGFTDTNSDTTPISYVTDGSDLSIEFTPYALSI